MCITASCDGAAASSYKLAAREFREPRYSGRGVREEVSGPGHHHPLTTETAGRPAERTCKSVVQVSQWYIKSMVHMSWWYM